MSIAAEDFPQSKVIKAVIPKDCFVPETATSLGYLSVSVIATALCTAIGIGMVGAIGTSIWTLPIWTAYSAVTGTVAMGLWVLAHECGMLSLLSIIFFMLFLFLSTQNVYTYFFPQTISYLNIENL